MLGSLMIVAMFVFAMYAYYVYVTKPSDEPTPKRVWVAIGAAIGSIATFLYELLGYAGGSP